MAEIRFGMGEGDIVDSFGTFMRRTGGKLVEIPEEEFERLAEDFGFKANKKGVKAVKEFLSQNQSINQRADIETGERNVRDVSKKEQAQMLLRAEEDVSPEQMPTEKVSVSDKVKREIEKQPVEGDRSSDKLTFEEGLSDFRKKKRDKVKIGAPTKEQWKKQLLGGFAK